MELSIDLARQILSMITICLIGFALAKFRVVNPDQSHVLSRVAMYTMAPFAIIQSFQSKLNYDQLSGLLLSFIAAITTHVIFIIIVHLMGKSPLKVTPEEQASAVYSNCGNLGIPLISGIASLGPAYVFYMSPFMAVQSTLLWTHGASLMQGSRRMDLKKVITNPCILAILAGFVIFFLQIPMPAPIQTTINNMSASLGPTCMLVIGLSLGAQDLKVIFSDKRVYGSTFLRLVFLPMVGVVVMYFLAQVWSHPDLENILIVMLICTLGPSASTVTQLGQLFHNKHTAYASAINIVTTLFCVVTMPAMVLLFQWLLHM